MNSFHDNPLYQLLSISTGYVDEHLRDLHGILHEQPELAQLYHPMDGSYVHIICRKTHDDDDHNK
jgi:hypothetical protein